MRRVVGVVPATGLLLVVAATRKWAASANIAAAANR